MPHSGDNLMDGSSGGRDVGGDGGDDGGGDGGGTNCSTSLEETIPNFLEQVSSSYLSEPYFFLQNLQYQLILSTGFKIKHFFKIILLVICYQFHRHHPIHYLQCY